MGRKTLMMKPTYLCGASVLAVAFSLGMSAPAFAQAAAEKSGPAVVEEVVVTGSYIAGTPEDSAARRRAQLPGARESRLADGGPAGEDDYRRRVRHR